GEERLRQRWACEDEPKGSGHPCRDAPGFGHFSESQDLGLRRRSYPGKRIIKHSPNCNAVASLAVVPDATGWGGVFAAVCFLGSRVAGAADGIESAAASRRTPGRF